MPERRSTVPLATTALVAVVLLGCCAVVARAAGNVQQTTVRGLSVAVDTTWVDGFGYRPVQVTITPVVPSAVDQTVTIELLARGWRRRDCDLRVAQDIEVAAGSGPAHATLAVPQYTALFSACEVNVLVDGELEASLSVPWCAQGHFGRVEANCPVVLVVGENLPDTTKLAALLPNATVYYGHQSLRAMTQAPTELPTAIARPLGELPSRWIDYSSLDVVCLSLGQLGQLQQQRPAVLRAMLDWAAAGGNLWVYGVGQDWQHLAELEELVGLPPAGANASTSAAPADAPSPSGWSQPDKTLYSQVAHVIVNQQGSGVTSTVNTMLATGSGQSIGTPDRAPEPPPFLLREYDMGLIVALAADDPFPGTTANWNWLLAAMGPERWLWTQRHGLSMTEPNPEFLDFLVPGVGLAPVTEFCVLLSVFVLAIGPLNYWLLRRWKRLHLLVITVPLGAAVVTLALFGYALLADGLGTRVRVRSVTLLDQGRRQATCWARASYYAGLAPGRGLMFPEDVVVLPLEHIPANSLSNRPPRRELIWEDGQWLASGWLGSRTRTQYVTVRSRPSSLGLKLVSSPGATGSDSDSSTHPTGSASATPNMLVVNNALGTRIEQLLVRSAAGDYYWGEDMEPGATAALGPIQPATAQTRLRETYDRHPRELPQGMDNRYYSSIFGFSRRRGPRYYSHWGGQHVSQPTQQTGRMEMTLARSVLSVGTGYSLLQPGSYVAVVDKSPEVALGVPSAREEASYHVILGRW